MHAVRGGLRRAYTAPGPDPPPPRQSCQKSSGTHPSRPPAHRAPVGAAGNGGGEIKVGGGLTWGEGDGGGGEGGTYPVVAPLSEVVHEEPQHVAVKHVGVVQAVLVPLQLVLLDHLRPPRRGGVKGVGGGSGPPPAAQGLGSHPPL